MAAPITSAQLRDLIARRPADIDSALQEVGPSSRVGIHELEAITGLSPSTEPDAFASAVIAYLQQFNLLDRFSGIIDTLSLQTATPQEIANANMAQDVGRRLFEQTVKARCAVFQGSQFKGTASLVGPTLVLTCAHVVGAANDDGTIPATTIQMADTAWVVVEDKPVLYSPFAPADTQLPLDADDAAYAGHSDFALLRLKVPAGASLSAVPIPATAWTPTVAATVALLHFPGEHDHGVGFGQIEQVTGPSCRWRYNAQTQGGSSGGPCFNTQGEFIGIHQGKSSALAQVQRLVPFELFQTELAAEVDRDLWPDYLWSLDGRIDGTLVIGRADLFAAFKIMAAPEARNRVLRIKRQDPSHYATGLGYSVNLVRRLIERQPAGHRAIVLSWPQAIYDDFDIIAQLISEARTLGIVAAQAGGDVAGAAEGQTGQATVIKGRSESLLADLARCAEQRGEIVWIIVENATMLPGSQVVALETLASLAPRWSRLRLVLIGNENVSLPDPELRVADYAAAGGGAGLPLVELLGPIARADVEEFIRRVHQDRLGEAPLDSQLNPWTNNVLAGLHPVNNRYDLSDLPAIAAKLRNLLEMILPPDLGGAP